MNEWERKWLAKKGYSAVAIKEIANHQDGLLKRRKEMKEIFVSIRGENGRYLNRGLSEEDCKWECDKQFTICVEGREGDKEFCYEDCEDEYENKNSSSYKRCFKKCDKKYEEDIEWCEDEGAECFEACEEREKERRKEKRVKKEEEPEIFIGEETMKRLKKKVMHWISTEERRKNTCDLDYDNLIKVVTSHTTYTPDLVSRGIDELKADGIIYSPREGVIRRVECEEIKKLQSEEEEIIYSTLFNLFKNDPEREWGITDINEETDIGITTIRDFLMKTKPETRASYARFYKREFDLSYKLSIENLL